MKRLLVGLVIVAACKQSTDKPAPAPAVSAGDAAAACERLELELVSAILATAAHPCRAQVDAALGRMVGLGVGFSGTLVTTAPARGAGLVLTCQHCTGVLGDGLALPEVDEPTTVSARAPARLASGKVVSGRDNELFFVYRLLSPMPPKAAFDGNGRLVNILPKHDFVVGTLSGEPIEVIGHLGAMAPPKVGDRDVELHDPRALARATTWFADPRPGSRALVLGFARDLEDKRFGGELVASVGEILDDTRARDLLARADPDEAAIPYDPEVELVVAAHAVPGMSGGGTFDADGRYLGINVRGTVAPVDGTYLVRVVRAGYVAKQLAAALAAAPTELRATITPFLP